MGRNPFSGWLQFDSHLIDEKTGFQSPDSEKSKRVTDAMLKMQEISVADLQKAYDG